MNRRRFLSSVAGAAMLPRSAFGAAPFAATAPVPRARPFALAQVRLRAGRFLDAAEVNRRFLMGLAPDRLLHTFRLTAGAASVAEPLGGWEAPANELRGHFTGHYLSACALRFAGFGDDEMKARGAQVVAGLAECQKALGSGYVSAFPEEFFDRLRTGQNVWAPWYTLHKIMAGLLDMHTLAGDAQALDVLQGLVRWTRRWVQPLGDASMARVLEREYGGMNAVLCDLAAVTGDAAALDLAHHFDHERIFGPLALGRDELKGLHVNTTIPKVVGAARRYELTGEGRYRDVAEYFWREVTQRRSYCTGGTSNGESWNAEAGTLAGELSGYTQECCCTYNMLKLTRHVFGWTADPAGADYYERALWNGVLGTQHPADGSKLYYVPLASGFWKLFGTPFQDFWCCTGTGVESFAKLADSIYFHDDRGVWVNLFLASEAAWPEKRLRIVQETRFPEEEATRLTLRCEAPVAMALRLRVPAWATGGRATLNGRPLEGFAAPGSYFVLDRTWHDGDRLEVSLPMSLRAQALPGDESQQALLYGPIVLAGRLGAAGLTRDTIRAGPTKPRTVPEYTLEPVPAPSLRATSSDPSSGVAASPSGPLEFRSAGPNGELSLGPLFALFDERYAVYWKIARDTPPSS
jgi:hypothetical protein